MEGVPCLTNLLLWEYTDLRLGLFSNVYIIGLKACHKALPENGKVIIRDFVIDSPKSSAAKVNAALHSDLLMMGLFNGHGRERILKEAGFPRPSLLSLEGFDVIEAVKT
jgi:hypothetical protein